jgi:very-short-patch-repair endonuclease
MSPISNIVIGQRPSSTMIQIADQLRRNMTAEEKILWQHLRANRLGGFHFRRQQIIDRYVADFYCHAAALVVEIDGEIHNQQIEQDADREAKLTARGLMVMRFKNQEVRNNLDDVLARILAVCKERTT